MLPVPVPCVPEDEELVDLVVAGRGAEAIVQEGRGVRLAEVVRGRGVVRVFLVVGVVQLLPGVPARVGRKDVID